MVSKAREDLPEPESPVRTTSWSRGISRSMDLRLCSRAPRTRGAARAREGRREPAPPPLPPPPGEVGRPEPPGEGPRGGENADQPGRGGGRGTHRPPRGGPRDRGGWAKEALVADPAEKD